MAKRTHAINPEEIRKELILLLTNFENELLKTDLRAKVLMLVPAFKLLRNLGCHLIPIKDARSARDRILRYFQKYPMTIITGEELMVVSGISEWARRVRELRVEYGWHIVNGRTYMEMRSAGDISANNSIDAKIDDYVLIDIIQDKESAHRWHVANDIRKLKNISVRDKILAFLKENIGNPVSSEELRYVANDKTEWARRIRELRTEYGWSVVTKNTGRPELPIGSYVLESLRQAPVHDRTIPDDVRVKVLMRDDFRCVECGWSHPATPNKNDPRQFLELHHVHEHAKGGANTVENLITLCNVHHDAKHRT